MTLEVQTDTARKLASLIANIEKVIVGKREAVTLAVVGLLAEGHLLLEDVPGTGKTTLARALARSVDLPFRRIQFTSDLLPTDVIGMATPKQAGGGFEFQPGPVFANIVLADELNRTPPRTQSALLECMNERSVSVDGESHELPRPFLVIATQNPLEFEGTYPLPESQLDRFLLRIELGYPGREAERELLRAQMIAHPIDSLGAVLSPGDTRALIAEVKTVRVDDALLDYLQDIVVATRDSGLFLLGASPRAALGLLRAAQARALIDGRDYCVPDDIKRMTVPVLAHRVLANFSAQAQAGAAAQQGREALLELLQEIDVPA